MIKIKNRKKVELILVVFYFITAILLIDYFLSKAETNGVWEWFLVTLVFFLAGPFVVLKFILRKDLKEQYFSLSFKKINLVRTLGTLLLVVALGWPFMVYFDWKQYVSVSRWVLGGTDFLLFIDLTLTPFVLFSREFFFRSFLLKSFISVFGVCGAIFIQALLSTFFEVYLSGFEASWQQLSLLFFLSVFLGYIAWLNKSILLSALLIWIYTIVVDMFFIYQKTNILNN